MCADVVCVVLEILFCGLWCAGGCLGWVLCLGSLAVWFWLLVVLGIVATASWCWASICWFGLFVGVFAA